jgi:hypothetical protein
MTKLDLKAAFLHVINDHRWLAASGCAWNLAGPNAEETTREKANEILPNIGVMILDSLLLHARLLIDFYTKRSSVKEQTDILLCDFSVSIDEKLCKKLKEYKRPIEVHLLHLTDWRDRENRDRNSVGKRAYTFRPDWNHEATPIVRLIFEALRDVSGHKGDWQPPFKDLCEASTERYQNRMFQWPAKLGEKPNVEQYLKGLGL